MTTHVKFDLRKATEVLLYIASQVPDTYKALKVLYFADKEHLARYGRLICGDSYVAMKHGPVPSGTYDLVKSSRVDGICSQELLRSASGAFTVDGNEIKVLRLANEDLLSDSDIECLEWAIKQYGQLSFSALKRISHKEPAYVNADQDDFIPLEAIVDSLPNGEALKEYLWAD